MNKFIKEFIMFLLMLAALTMMATMVSCRSVKESSVMNEKHQRVSVEADTMTAKSVAEKTDSMWHYRLLADSLINELAKSHERYNELLAKDSVSENMYRADSVYVKDSVWSVVGADGQVTNYRYTEKNKYSYQQFEKYKESIVKESQRTIDSLVSENTHLHAACDSLEGYKQIIDSLCFYNSHISELGDTASFSNEVTKVEGRTWWEKVKERIGLYTIVMVISLVVAIIGYYTLNKKA